MKTLRLLICLLAMFAMPFTFAACNTMEGAGEDIEGTGEAIEDTADDADWDN